MYLRGRRGRFGAVIAVFITLVYLAEAQINQRWHYVNGQPHWRREASITGRPVLFPEHDVIFEYNCHYMPSICQNVRNWYADTDPVTGQAKSTWATRGGNDVFTYDLTPGRSTYRVGASAFKSGAGHRRDAQCPRTWSNGGDRCPEPNQPYVMPGPWLNTALETIDSLAEFEIEGIRILDPEDVVRSGRQYSCDEFPPASWIEGGIGPGGAANAPGDQGGTAGNTYCAPRMMPSSCSVNAAGRIRSEQDWQGTSHNVLASRLRAQIMALPNNVNWRPRAGDTARFRFRMINSASVGPARVWWKTGTNPDENRETETKPPKRWAEANETAELFSSRELLTAADYQEFGYQSDEVILVNGTVPVVRLGDEGVVPEQTLESSLAADDLLHDFDETKTTESDAPSAISNSSAPLHQPQNNTTDIVVQPWNITAADVDESLMTYSFKTQQQPSGDHIDILSIGTAYILGQISPSNMTNETTPWNSTLAARQVIEGLIQCGPGSPCKDDSCCNKDGKCGYKEANCGATCISNCGAKAMCGIDSADGKTPCGLKLCCSYYGWCGTETVHCKDPEPQYGKTPCQQGFGSCEIKDPPSCGKGSGTSGGRKVGYYQGWNTRERTCEKVRPRDINTRGLTHLFYSFAFFHPQTFQMMPMNEADIPLYGEFTALKRNGLQTWIAIGGWSFNDPGDTQTAFSDMVSTRANRQAFISSLATFIETYGFQGADIDWEYPSEAKRGGRPQDADNLVLLMKEIREAFGPRGWGSSLALAPDYWYLRGFKPAAMQQYVDFMGFMSYDLHGPWDTDVKSLGSIVRPQTDVTEISKGLMPLWYDGVDPSKINMGLAYYGRTYTLANPSCGQMGCSFIPETGGAAGECTKFPGILSNREIQGIIKDQGITPYFNATAMVKYFTYSGNSWVGYDDAETYAMKTAFANDLCLGGTMIWSIDFDAETGGGNSANEYKSPESATIIPMAHTTVAQGATFTLGQSAATDVVALPNNGDQNSPKGPGDADCGSCSFFRLITSTCCGTGGSVGNPIVIPASVPVPIDIPLPAGFIPGQTFTDPDGNRIPAGQPLPRETILPRGTVFTSPFVISPGQPLRVGEDDDSSGNGTLIWISPDIWNEENPQLQCFPPCTIVLPPWPKTTATIDYPRVTSTVTTSGRTTTTVITFPPITQSRWPVSTIVIEEDPSQTGRTRTTRPTPKTTTLWPETTWNDRDDGRTRTTRPILPPPPPPPPQITLPPLSIKPGPPFPTVPPCAFPGPGCPGPGEDPEPNDPEDPEIGPDPDAPIDPNETEEEGDPDDTCLIRTDEPDEEPEEEEPEPTVTTSTTTLPPTTTTTTIIAKPTPNKPDTSQDKVGCYDSGQWTYRWRTIQAIERLCGPLNGQLLKAGDYKEYKATWGEASRTDWEVANVEVIASIEIKEGCEWKLVGDECAVELRKIVDECDTNGENRKQGGKMENNCLKWRLDPNAG